MAWLTIDASQVTKALKVIEQSAEVTPQILAATLDAATRQRIALLRANTPYQERVDPRYPVHMRDSYHYRGIGDTRQIYIEPLGSAFKFMYITEGTSAHTILPNAKKALYWPGLERPVAYARHPGTRPNPFHERSEQQYSNSGIDDMISTTTANGIVGVITDTINANNASMGSFGVSGILSSMLGLAALLSMLAGIGSAALA
jgi:hypothetical protein